MRKYLVLSFLFLLPISSTAQENNYFLMLKNKKVNVRYGPSLDHPVKYIYKKIDLPVKVIDKKENFRRIIDHKKNSGWIHISQLRKTNSLIVLEDKIVFNKNTKFSKPLFKVAKGRLVILKECINSWCKIKSNNYSGWIQKKNSWGEIRK